MRVLMVVVMHVQVFVFQSNPARNTGEMSATSNLASSEKCGSVPGIHLRGKLTMGA